MSKKQGNQMEYTVMEDGKEVKYIFQHPGYLEATRIKDRSKNPAGIAFVEETLFTEIMKHVIVSPRTSWAYWEEHEGYKEVMEEAQKFLMD